MKPSRKDNRFVHAKWYEFQTETRRLLLTGSINATRKALMTTDNVELGVLRALAPGSAPLEWEAAERPAFAPDERLPSGLKGNEIVYAGFDRQDNSLVTGRIISLYPQSDKPRITSQDVESWVHAALAKTEKRGIAEPLPPDIVKRLTDAAKAAHADPEVRSKLEAQGYDVTAETGPQLLPNIKEQIVRWGKLVKAAGFSAEDRGSTR